ncbi:hypothetical protein FF38_14346 [Lucilia cuprina]|uniref:Vitellogenin domain-containing protein n=1 Tax=Lucilia cuprina TaxID=7375 RepID=A0A0L0CG67_LUCCU|nr:hypothetical protein FF38_14346 [Lucilia cuprina]
MIIRFLRIIVCLIFYSCCCLAAASSPLIPYESQQYYVLENKVSTKQLQHVSSQETSYTFNSLLKINSVWNSDNEQLLQVYFTENRVSAPGKKGNVKVQEIEKIPDRPFYISFIDNKPSKVIAHTSRDQSLLNMERGIASLMHINFENGPVSEIDVSGMCNNFYNIKSSTKVNKIKTDCSHWDLKVNYRAEKPLGVHQKSFERVEYDLSADGQLLLASSVETHKLSLEALPEVGTQVESLLFLKHTTFAVEPVEQLPYKTSEEAIKSLLEWYRVFEIEADVDGVISEIKDITLKQQVASFNKDLTDDLIGKKALAEAFVKLVPLARITKQEEFVEILKSNKKLHSQLVDLLGAVQTIDAHKAIHEIFDFNKKSDVDLLEKYYQSLSVGTHPERSIIEDLFERLTAAEENAIKNEKLQDSVLQCVASLTHQSGFDANDKLLKEIKEFILKNLLEICKDEVCKTRYIRSLQNLRDPTTISILMKYALKEETKISVAAMQALKSFPIIHFNEKHRQAFTHIFYQIPKKYDSSARTLALDILLDMKPTPEQLGHLLDYLASNDRHFEIKTYVIQKLKMLSDKCPRFRALLETGLHERPHINNYHIIGQKEDYLHFGGTEEESRQAAYYLSADSGSNIGPTDELKRTQRSFWKKLFKNGLFGECDNCCNNCNYNVGNGDNYSPAPSPLLPFQPFRPLPLWQNLQPLFGPVSYDSYGRGSYNNPPRYNGNAVNNPPSYDNNVPQAPETVYEIPTELPPVEPEYNVDNSPAVEELYEPPAALPENTYSLPEPSTYTKEETPKAVQYANGKVPQIIYQPIIYVSPQYQGNKDVIKQIQQEETKYDEEPKEEYKPLSPSYEKESESESASSSYSSDAESTKLDDSSNDNFNKSEPQTPVVVTPCSQSYAVPSTPCLSPPLTNPALSAVSTVYNIITPSLLHTLTAGQSPSYITSVTAPNVPCSNEEPSKYSLTPSNVIPLDSYSLPPSSPAPVATAYLSSPAPMTAPKPAPAPMPQSYIQPIHMSSDDQPYRVCPELFEEYQRKLNTILPHIHAGRGGSLTTVLSRELSWAPAFNESLLSTQEIYQGVLKRGSVELILSAGREETSTFKLGIYTSGLTSFVGDSDEDTNDDDEEVDDSPATAGMEIAVQGVLLRPLIFFTGQSELMGHVWSGTASDPTPAFQATTLAQDHEHYIILSSGATVYTRVIGSKSVDLNGKVDFSIWNRNANTEIQQNSAAAVHGIMKAGFTYAQVSNEFLLTYEPKISLQADIDFYSGIKLCMQLQRPEMQLKHFNTQLVTLQADHRFSKKVLSKYSYNFPGRTLALNQKNNEMCNMIFN